MDGWKTILSCWVLVTFQGRAVKLREGTIFVGVKNCNPRENLFVFPFSAIYYKDYIHPIYHDRLGAADYRIYIVSFLLGEKLCWAKSLEQDLYPPFRSLGWAVFCIFLVRDDWMMLEIWLLKTIKIQRNMEIITEMGPL